MRHVTEYSKQELNDMLKELTIQFQEARKLNLKLNMARGKPAAAQLDMNMGLLEFPEGCTLEDGTDARNYGVLEGIPECRRLLGRLLGLKPDQIIIGGNSSLNLMFDTMAYHCLFGTQGEKPWSFYAYEGSPVKFLCPVPGYDRHFQICEELGIQMIPVPLLEDGPDMEMVEAMVREDASIKGIWCVPLHSNPQGVCYSDRVVDRLASMETAAPDFRIFWDNAYGVHHLYDHDQDHLIEILAECKRAGNPDLVYKFASTSKISFPGSGIAAIATSHNNLEDIKAQLKNQTIGHDKVNQLRHARFFKDIHGMVEHMRKHADIIRPKFEAVEEILERELEGLGIGRWTKPRGGYFISFDSLEGCAKDIVARCKKAGVVMTSAGATYPYGKDPHDSNIRIAPTYPTLGDLITAAELFALCVKLSSVEKLLKTMA